MTKAQVTALVDQMASIARLLQGAGPNDRAEVYRQLGVRLTYHR
jgi:hypothetical protein